MVQYYNLTKLAQGDGIMGFWKGLTTISIWFPLFLLTIVFVIPILVMIQKGKDPLDAIHVASLYTMLFGLTLYFTQIITSSLFIFIPGLIYALTMALKWYNK